MLYVGRSTNRKLQLLGIKTIGDLAKAALELAVDDDILRKNPAKGALGDYGRTPKERIALTSSQQEKILAFIKTHNVYNAYYPMICFMIGTGLRCGELIGLTWNDVDMKKKIINVDHQLIYKNLGDGCKFHITTPKTEAGVRIIPMLDNVRKALEEQRKLNFLLARNRDFEIEGYTDFIFLAKTGRPLMPNGVNSALKNIVDAYNKAEVVNAKKERRKAELFPNISAHIMRHTACTRMAEQGMDVKVLQYIMGHENIEVTMQVYNHISDMSRVENEIIRMNALAVDF
ncbi:MAG: tyrosine-type recombinase/integrase [Lachnospiraceae bacterium]|nr:tyrosine-type recombinase/integrase [Lachnospiraceae bacterium]